MSKPPRTDVVTVFIMNDGRYVKEHEFDRLKAELEQTRATLATAEAEIRGAIKLCGEYAINAKEGLYASLALSIGRLKHQIECELAHKKKLSDCANSGMAANENLFEQLSEARAEIENLKWHISNEKAKAKAALELNDRALEQLAEARAEIERLRSRNKMLDTAIAEMTEEQAALCAEEQSITELVATKDKLIEQMKDEIERLALEIENKQYTITCASEENQQLKESLAEARAEIERLKTPMITDMRENKP